MLQIFPPKLFKKEIGSRYSPTAAIGKRGKKCLKLVKLSINNHIVGLFREHHIINEI